MFNRIVQIRCLTRRSLADEGMVSCYPNGEVTWPFLPATPLYAVGHGFLVVCGADWKTAVRDPAVRKMWWNGVPPKLRGIAWEKTIGNSLALSKGSHFGDSSFILCADLCHRYI